MKKTQNIQRGFSLVTAIFLLVVIAALGTFALTLSTTQQQSAAMDVLGARAYQASRVGIEWAAHQVLRNSAAGFEQACTTNPGGTSQPVTPLPNTLQNFSVLATCTSTAVSDVGVPLMVYQITSTASGVGGAAVGSQNYIERQISVTIAQ